MLSRPPASQSLRPSLRATILPGIRDSWRARASVTFIAWSRWLTSKTAPSNTFMLGEKQINPDHYLDGQDGGDDWSMYTRLPRRQCARLRRRGRSAYYPLPPMQDTPGNGTASLYFGSPHSGSLNMSLCDASVRPIDYSIDFELFRRLCNRKDGMPTNSLDGRSDAAGSP